MFCLHSFVAISCDMIAFILVLVIMRLSLFDFFMFQLISQRLIDPLVFAIIEFLIIWPIIVHKIDFQPHILLAFKKVVDSLRENSYFLI